MKHKCDNCEHKYINNSGSGICLMFNSYEQAYEAYNAETCPYAEPKITNFERIKAMSIEEMAEFIFVNFQTDDWYNPIVDNKVMFHENDVAEWLESEVQEE